MHGCGQMVNLLFLQILIARIRILKNSTTMQIAEIINFLESLAHPSLQEHYDNAGLITGSADWECKGIICSLDSTEDVVKEAIEKKCNLVVAHHPIIFGGLKKINGKNYVEKTIIAAIKNDIAIYAIHTNLDNVMHGVSGKMAKMLGLQNLSVLSPKENTLKKLFVFVPVEKQRMYAMPFLMQEAGILAITANAVLMQKEQAHLKPVTVVILMWEVLVKQHQEKEIKIEVIFPAFLENKIVNSYEDRLILMRK